MARSGGSFEALVVALCSFLCVDKLTAWLHRLLASCLRHEQINGVWFYAGWRRSLLGMLRRPSFVALIGAVVFETLVFASIAKAPNPIYWKLVFAGLLLLALVRVPGFSIARPGHASGPALAGMLEVRDLDFSYQIGTENRSVFDRASWRLGRGLHVLKGMNGAGKTTMLKLLAGFLRALGGGIWFGPERLDHRPPHERPFFYMHQDPLRTLTPELTALENLAASFQPTSNPIRCLRPADLFLALDERLKAQGVALFKSSEDPFWFKPVENISFGEAHCVALYCAVLSGARVFLADEPTTGLDQDNFDRLTRLLRALAKEHIIIVTSHDRRLNDLADQVFWIKEHKIELDDQH
jgi:ABC-type multidrug transport system ATPase subunit